MTFPEGTRQWAEQQRDRAYREARKLLVVNGFDPQTYGVLRDISQQTWLDQSGQGKQDALDDWDAYRNWKAEFGAMSEWLADGRFPDADEPIYSAAELEAAGQGVLL